jgi:hypothetical protein
VKPTIALITLAVSDLAASLSFYRDGLGFPTHHHEPGDDMIMFALEGTFLGLYPREKLADDAGIDAQGGGFPGFTLSHNAPSPAEVDAVYQLALGAGARPVRAPREVFWGGYSGYFADPDGYLWEVAYNPFTDLT